MDLEFTQNNVNKKYDIQASIAIVNEDRKPVFEFNENELEKGLPFSICLIIRDKVGDGYSIIKEYNEDGSSRISMYKVQSEINNTELVEIGIGDDDFIYIHGENFENIFTDKDGYIETSYKDYVFGIAYDDVYSDIHSKEPVVSSNEDDLVEYIDGYNLPDEEDFVVLDNESSFGYSDLNKLSSYVYEICTENLEIYFKIRLRKLVAIYIGDSETEELVEFPFPEVKNGEIKLHSEKIPYKIKVDLGKIKLILE